MTPFQDGYSCLFCESGEVKYFGPALVGIEVVVGVGRHRREDESSIESQGEIGCVLQSNELL